jgi:putative transposase
MDDGFVSLILRELCLSQGAIEALLRVMAGRLAIRDLLLDDHFGNNPTGQMARRCGLHLISKLRHDGKLFLSYQGTDRRRKYGKSSIPGKCRIRERRPGP